MRDTSKNTKPVVALAPAVRTASATGGGIDRLGFEALSFLITTGAYTDGTHTVVVQESDDGTTWTAISAANLIGTLPVAAAAGAANTATLVGYIGDARYVRIQSNVTGATNGAVVGAVVLLGRARIKPAV